MKQPKYRNKKVDYDGFRFDSIRERNRYIFLRSAEREGRIQNLELQPVFPLINAVKDADGKTLQRAITYRADFRYTKSGQIVIEDVKASPEVLPKEYQLKAKIFFARYGMRIKQVYIATAEI